MLAKYTVPIFVLLGALLSGCGDSGSGSTGGSGQGGSGGSTSTAGSGGTGGMATGGTGGMSTGGSGGTTTTTTSTSVTGCQPLGDACTNCLADKCNALYCTCYDNPACGSLVACTQACAPGDAACNQACFTNNQNGISEAALVNDCGATQCGASCPGTTALDGCSLCLFQSCSAQMNACFGSADCNAIVTCVQGCGGDFFCQGDCYNDPAHQAGQGLVDNLNSCLQDKCSGQCG